MVYHTVNRFTDQVIPDVRHDFPEHGGSCVVLLARILLIHYIVQHGDDPRQMDTAQLADGIVQEKAVGHYRIDVAAIRLMDAVQHTAVSIVVIIDARDLRRQYIREHERRMGRDYDLHVHPLAQAFMNHASGPPQELPAHLRMHECLGLVKQQYYVLRNLIIL